MSIKSILLNLKLLLTAFIFQHDVSLLPVSAGPMSCCAGLAAYGLCQTACNTGYGACCSSCGAVAGAFCLSGPGAIIAGATCLTACSVGQGGCMAACATQAAALCAAPIP